MAPPRVRHVPMRTCVGCRQERPKRELVRVVRAPSGELHLDDSGRAAGRGAYLCRNADCWTAAMKKGALAGALRMTLSADDRARVERARDEALGAADPR